MEGRRDTVYVDVEWSDDIELPDMSAPGTYKNIFFCIFQPSPISASDKKKEVH